MRIIDCYPTKGYFPPGEPVRVNVQIGANRRLEGVLQVDVLYLEQTVTCVQKNISMETHINDFMIEFVVPVITPRGYGLSIRLLDDNERVIDKTATSFDVLSSWVERPRYGFLTDFSVGRTDPEQIITTLVRHHINGLQFYDWQYRHDHLLPKTETYQDPLGRQLSMHTVEAFITTAHAKGIAAMPYLAVYAASLEFWRDHIEWAMYDVNGKALDFEGFLGLMDPSPHSPWIDHLLNQCAQVLKKIDFDGLHIDQYGEPKIAYDAWGAVIDLPAAFNAFICQLKEMFQEKVVTFNAVANWPIDYLAVTPLDFLYIEVWPDTPKYTDLLQIVNGGRRKSQGHSMVIALYLPVERMDNILLANALIMASGGTRIEIGEHERLLTDPYFPKHQAIPTDLLQTMRRYHDFQVWYGDLIGPQAEDVVVDGSDELIVVPAGVWVIRRRIPGWLVLNLINFSGLSEPRWDEEHPPPIPLDAFQVRFKCTEHATRVWVASPDIQDISPSEAAWIKVSGTLEIEIPRLDCWTLVMIKIEQ